MTTNETEAREALERIHTNLAGAYGYKLTEEDLTDFESIKAAIASRDSEKQRADLAEARIEDLEQALNIAKRAILNAAQDTLWCDDSAAETVVDRINAALDPDKTGDLFNTEQELERLRESGQWQPIEGWHEDMGNVIMAHVPVCEPYYIGSPLDSGFEEYPENWFTHFISMDCIPTHPERA